MRLSVSGVHLVICSEGIRADDIMSKRNSALPDKCDLDAKAIDALMKAQNMPPGLARTEALKKAEKLCHAAGTYKYLFSNELTPPE
jgi:hypothetical protein